MTEVTKQVSLSEVRTIANYRTAYDDSKIQEWAGDMGRNDGSGLQIGYSAGFPMQCYQDGAEYVVITGNTRHKSAMLGSAYSTRTHQPTLMVWITVQARPSAADFCLIQLAENERRVTPNDLDTARGYRQTLDALAAEGKTPVEAMRELKLTVGHPEDYIARRLVLLDLIPEVQELVGKKQFGITFAACMARLDSNFQHQALVKYRSMKAPTFEDFEAVANDCYTAQNQCSLFDFALFGGTDKAPVAAVEVVKVKTRAELLAEVAALQARLAKMESAVRTIAARAKRNTASRKVAAAPQDLRSISAL